jgi:hypothetical protein
MGLCPDFHQDVVNKGERVIVAFDRKRPELSVVEPDVMKTLATLGLLKEQKAPRRR